MAITDIDWGTVTLTNGSTAVTGTGTSFIADDIRDGDTFVFVDGGDGFQQPIVESVQSNTALTLREPWLGPTLSAVTYTLRYQWDSSRVSAMSRRLIMLLDNGNLTAFSQLTGPGVAVFDGPHSMVIRPLTDFVNGVSFDVQVDTLADRAAYDGQTEGFTVLVSDMGDGRSAVFTKNSNTSADWSDAAYITGPVGPLPEVEATVTELPPGSAATVVPTPIVGGVRLDFNLPQASGFNNEGVYSAAVAYVRDDVVRHNGSSFIALQTVPAGTSPSNAFPPGDTAFWQVLAAKGADGDIDGVTPFWQGRLTADTDAAAARVGLGAVSYAGQTLTPAEQGQARANIGADVLGGFRNKLINGDFLIAQRGSSGSGYGSGTYTFDRWRHHFSTGLSAAYSFVSISPGGRAFKGYGQFVVSGTGAAGSNIRQLIENGVIPLAGEKVTVTAYLSLGVAGTVKIALRQNFGTGGSPSAETLVEQSFEVTTLLSRYDTVFTLPSVSGMTFGTNGDDYLELFIVVDEANTQTLRVGHVSLVKGDATAEADPFSPRHIQQELALCQRYYEVMDYSTAGLILNMRGNSATTSACGISRPFNTAKRALPTISGYTFNNSTGGSVTAEKTHVSFLATATAMASVSGLMAAEAEL